MKPGITKIRCVGAPYQKPGRDAPFVPIGSIRKIGLWKFPRRIVVKYEEILFRKGFNAEEFDSGSDSLMSIGKCLDGHFFAFEMKEGKGKSDPVYVFKKQQHEVDPTSVPVVTHIQCEVEDKADYPVVEKYLMKFMNDVALDGPRGRGLPLPGSN